MKKFGIITSLIIVLIIGSMWFVVSRNGSTTGAGSVDIGDKIKIYKGSTCGCCSIYVGYLQQKIKQKIDVIDLSDVNSIKDEYNIPNYLQSCHTTIIGDYFIEGHIPIEAINKLLQEKPDIKGIAMPGMPSGSPGMPGAKSGAFVIYAVKNDGSSEEFVKI